ncbi:hypothetical protein Golob_023876 [Gossypium lobatum]|uniref:Uncharacterized protein n=1 Tax=Gossypium lobatum TaxID=34289 RepID=A0A7J8NHN3_9ROSI|nr:hypothetical protein [Gossypium lobatum]
MHIPLAKAPHDDFLAWSGELLGEYSVRSAYKLLQRSDDPSVNALQTDYSNYFVTRYGQSEEKEIVDYMRKLVDLGKKL